jgi:uncharacterized membrane protein
MTLNVRDQVRQLESRINELGTRTPETPVSTPAPGAVTPAEPVAPAVEPAAVAPPPVAPAPATSTTLEEKFGTQWVVWIGGLALALGGIFLGASPSSKACSAQACAFSSPESFPHC